MRQYVEKIYLYVKMSLEFIILRVKMLNSAVKICYFALLNYYLLVNANCFVHLSRLIFSC